MKVVKVETSQGGLGKADGAELAPERILEQAKEIFMSESNILPNFDVESVNIISGNIEETNQNIYKKALETFNNSNSPVFLGGDHF